MRYVAITGNSDIVLILRPPDPGARFIANIGNGIRRRMCVHRRQAGSLHLDLGWPTRISSGRWQNPVPTTRSPSITDTQTRTFEFQDSMSFGRIECWGQPRRTAVPVGGDFFSGNKAPRNSGASTVSGFRNPVAADKKLSARR